MASLLAFAGLSSFAACADLAPIPSETCGNAVTEPGEDCDGEPHCYEPGTAFACRWRCETTADCPAGACGVDQVCRRPSGQFVVKQSIAAAATLTITVGDLDQDGRDDVVREGEEVTDVLFVGDDGLIESTETIERERGLTRPIIADFTEATSPEEDNLLDVAFPVHLGFEAGTGLAVYRTQADRSLEAASYPFVTIEQADVVRGVAAQVVGQESRHEIVGFVEGGIAPPFIGFGAEQTLIPLPAAADPVVSSFAGIVLGEFVDNGCDEIVYAEHASSMSAGDRIYIVEPCVDAGGEPAWNTSIDDPLIRQLVLPSGRTVADPDILDFGYGLPSGAEEGETEPLDSRVRSSVFAGDVSGDDRDDVIALLVSVDEPSDRRLEYAERTDTGFLPFTELECTVFGDVDCSLFGSPLAVADLDGDGTLDVVFERAVILLEGSVGEAAFVDMAWTAGIIADLDRDGLPDVAGARFDDGFETITTGIEVLRNAGGGVFSRDVIPTQRPVTQLVSGDFDGDLVNDLAFVEESQSASALDAVYVAFGQTAGGLTTPKKIGELPEIEQIVAGKIAGGDGTDELMVIAMPQSTPALALFTGNTSRQLAAPFIFSFRNNLAQLVATEIESIAAGRFDESAPATQLGVLTASLVGGVGGGSLGDTPGRAIWTVDVEKDAILKANPPPAEVVAPPPPEVDCDACQLLAYDPDGDGLDALHILAPQLSGADFGSTIIRRISVTPEGVESEEELIAIDDALLLPFTFVYGATNTPVVRDVDADGDDDLAFIGLRLLDEGEDFLASFEEFVVIVYNDNGNFTRVELVEAPSEGAQQVTAFDFLQTDPDPELELVLAEVATSAEEGQVWIMERDHETGVYGSTPEQRRPLVAGREVPSVVLSLAGGDFDGDGVPDVMLGGIESYAVVKGVAVEP